MTQLSSLAVDVVIDSPPSRVWAAVTDWPRQSDWVLATAVRNTSHDGIGVDATFEAFTGIGSLGFLDTMRITEWVPPHRVVVAHTGKVIRGWGVVEVFALPHDRSRLVWREELSLPMGQVGRLAWPIVRPLVARGVQMSLEAFRHSVEADRLPNPGSADSG